jgi:DNA-binding NarL/FixJ family response regulator
LEQLSLREKEVLEKLAEGCLVKEIADQLQVGFGTVRTYIRRIYEKLHVRSRAQATAQYYQLTGYHPQEKRPNA